MNEIDLNRHAYSLWFTGGTVLHFTNQATAQKSAKDAMRSRTVHQAVWDQPLEWEIVDEHTGVVVDSSELRVNGHAAVAG